MRKVTGTFSGEKLALEETKKDDKLVINLYLLCGFESVKFSIRDNELWQKVKKIPEREIVTVKAEAAAYKDGLYLQAKEIM